MQNKPKILFLSTGDATRSHMAQGFLTKLGGGDFHIVSTGVEAGELNPLAAEAMMEAGIDVRKQQLASVADSLKSSFTYAIIIYDSVSERPPIFPFALKLRRWSVADPCRKPGTPAERKQAFRAAREQIRVETQKLFAEIGHPHSDRTPIAA